MNIDQARSIANLAILLRKLRIVDVIFYDNLCDRLTVRVFRDSETI